jgi:hypothetical protein
MHGFGSMASALYFGFVQKVQHCHSDQYYHALESAGFPLLGSECEASSARDNHRLVAIRRPMTSDQEENSGKFH